MRVSATHSTTHSVNTSARSIHTYTYELITHWHTHQHINIYRSNQLNTLHMYEDGPTHTNTSKHTVVNASSHYTHIYTDQSHTHTSTQNKINTQTYHIQPIIFRLSCLQSQNSIDDLVLCFPLPRSVKKNQSD